MVRELCESICRLANWAKRPRNARETPRNSGESYETAANILRNCVSTWLAVGFQSCSLKPFWRGTPGAMVVKWALSFRAAVRHVSPTSPAKLVALSVWYRRTLTPFDPHQACARHTRRR